MTCARWRFRFTHSYSERLSVLHVQSSGAPLSETIMLSFRTTSHAPVDDPCMVSVGVRVRCRGRIIHVPCCPLYKPMQTRSWGIVGGLKAPLVNTCANAPLRKYSGSRQLAFYVCILRRIDRRLRRILTEALFGKAPCLQSPLVRPFFMVT